ncbi:MAG: complex I subunit 5 family protein [bacterium]
MNQLLLWPILVPLLAVAGGYFLLRFTGLSDKTFYLLVAISNFIPLVFLAGPVLGGRVFTYRMGGWFYKQGIILALDRFSFFMLVLVSFYFLIAFVWGQSSKIEERSRFFILLCVSQAGMGGLALTADIFNMYVFLEIVSITLYALVAYKKTAEGMEAGFKYIIIGSLGGFFILWAIGLVYGATGNLNLAYLSQNFAGVPSTIKIATLTFFTVGFALKFAIFPLHAWKVDVMTGAPVVINALLAGIGGKIPLYCLLRIYSLLFGWDYLIEVGLFSILSFLAVITIFVGHLMAFRQDNLKRLLAYSSVAHIGYIVAALAVVTSEGIQGAVFHVLNHGIMKAGLFLIAGAFIYELGTENIDELKGAHYRRPFLSVSFLILSLGMIGMPPVNGFLSKWQMVLSTMAAGAYISSLAIIIGGFMALLYYLRIAVSLFSRAEENNTAENEKYSLALNFKLPIYSLVFISLAIFINANIFHRLIGSVITPLFEISPYVTAILEGV